MIPSQEIADALMERGFNVKIKAPREEGDAPRMHLPVKIYLNARGPKIHLVSDGNRHVLTRDEFGIIDQIDILNADLDIRAFDWNYAGRTGRSACLEALFVEQDLDRFASRYASEEHPED